MARVLKLVILEPYYGGSHAAFVEAFRHRSRHHATLVTLPARKWKWRMRGAAIWFARNADTWLGSGGGAVEAILCSDMLSVADLRALLPRPARELPLICYFHENQLTYPVPNEDDRDYQYGMTNITSCLAADAVWFNSRFHLDGFLAAADRLLGKMPDYVPKGICNEIADKSLVLPPPIWAERVQRTPARGNRTLTILWCHRWEYDKNPEPFFDALLRLDDAGYPFNLVLVGEQFRTAPEVFANAWPRLQRHILHAGYLSDRAEYLALLSRCDVVVSTAIQENFGVAVIEAILAGCQPLLPARLSYPEVIPVAFHHTCLYPDDAALFDHLRGLLAGRKRLSATELPDLQSSLEARFGLAAATKRLDEGLLAVVERCSG